MTSFRAVIAEDEAVLREGIRKLLAELWPYAGSPRTEIKP